MNGCKDYILRRATGKLSFRHDRPCCSAGCYQQPAEDRASVYLRLEVRGTWQALPLAGQLLEIDGCCGLVFFTSASLAVVDAPTPMHIDSTN